MAEVGIFMAGVRKVCFSPCSGRLIIEWDFYTFGFKVKFMEHGEGHHVLFSGMNTKLEVPT